MYCTIPPLYLLAINVVKEIPINRGIIGKNRGRNMTKQHLEAAVDAINNDHVSSITENAVRNLFQQFSDVVKRTNRNVAGPEVEEFIACFTKEQSYLLKDAKIIRYVPGVEDNTSKAYKDFEVTFQNVTIRLQRRSNAWAFIYSITS